jgi:hypothetical protein
MAFKTITYAPGLFKIFDEILVNAADNKVRDPSMDTVRVDIDQVGQAAPAAGGGTAAVGSGWGLGAAARAAAAPTPTPLQLPRAAPRSRAAHAPLPPLPPP